MKRPALMTMADMFDSGSSSALQWCSKLTSPAARLITYMFSLLQDANDVFWIVIRGNGWTEELLAFTFTVSMLLVGHLFMRCVAPFLVWPWLCGIIVHDDEPQEAKDEVIYNLTGARKCENCFDKYFTGRLLPGQTFLVPCVQVFMRCVFLISLIAAPRISLKLVSRASHSSSLRFLC